MYEICWPETRLFVTTNYLLQTEASTKNKKKRLKTKIHKKKFNNFNWPGKWRLWYKINYVLPTMLPTARTFQATSLKTRKLWLVRLSTKKIFKSKIGRSTLFPDFDYNNVIFFGKQTLGQMKRGLIGCVEPCYMW